MRQEILGVERRRRWTMEEKVRILAEVGMAGATVADVARRHDISRQNIYQWRRDVRKSGLMAAEAPHFLAVEVAQEESEGDHVTGADVRVEIGLRNGRILRLPGDAPDSVVARMIRIAEAV